MTATNDELRKLVIARLDTMPPYMKISLGSGAAFTKEELIEHVRQDDEVGKKIVEMQLFYLRSMIKAGE